MTTGEMTARQKRAWHESAVEGIRVSARSGWPVFAWVPMRGVNYEGLHFIEKPPVAYLNQMEAKRIASRTRKRWVRAKRGIIPRKGNRTFDFAPVTDYTRVIGIKIQ